MQPEHPEIHHEEERWPTRLQRHQEEPAVRRGERRVSREIYSRPLRFELVFNHRHEYLSRLSSPFHVKTAFLTCLLVFLSISSEVKGAVLYLQDCCVHVLSS